MLLGKNPNFTYQLTIFCLFWLDSVICSKFLSLRLSQTWFIVSPLISDLSFFFSVTIKNLDLDLVHPVLGVVAQTQAMQVAVDHQERLNPFLDKKYENSNSMNLFLFFSFTIIIGEILGKVFSLHAYYWEYLFLGMMFPIRLVKYPCSLLWIQNNWLTG